MHRISGRIIRLFIVSGIQPDTGTGFGLLDIRLDTENSRVSSQIYHNTKLLFRKLNLSLHLLSVYI
jgi:hypothetical protein